MKIRCSNWNGKNSIRVQVETIIGSLWFGGAYRPQHKTKDSWILYNGAWHVCAVHVRQVYKAAWVIYNGFPFSWQITTLRPHVVTWKA